MELTDAQRAELTEIAKANSSWQQYSRDSRPTNDFGPAAKYARKRKREKLAALRKAWDALDDETREDILAHVLRMWDDYGQDSRMPDVGRIADDLAESTKRPPHREEEIAGFKEATLYLWRALYQDWGGPRLLDGEARSAIGAELAHLFNLSQDEAERRAKQDIDELRKAGVIGG